MIDSIIYVYISKDINKLKEKSKDMASKMYMLSLNNKFVKNIQDKEIEYTSTITSLPTGEYQLTVICRN